MANINGYRILQDIQTGEHLTVYLVEDLVHGGTAILRLTNQPVYREAWNELYRNYDRKVKNHKYLPALKKLDTLDDRSLSVLEGSEGNLLESGQTLTSRQIDQFVEAVLHLHQNQILLGKISRFNIWIRENGDISLYGAGERAVFNPEIKSTIEDDLKNVLMIIKNHSPISKSHFDGLSFGNIEELQEWVLSKFAIPKRGLVDKGVSSEAVFGNPDKKGEEQQESFSDHSSFQPKEEKKKNPTFPILLSGIAVLLIIIFSLSLFRSESEQVNKKVNEPTKTQQQGSAAGEDKEEKKNKEKQDAEISHLAPLFSGWEIIKHTSINLAGSDYTLVATAQKRDNESSGGVKVSVLSQGQNTEWSKVWESPEYESLLSEPDTYVKNFLTLTSNDGKAALLVYDLPDNEALGISRIKAVKLQANGSAEEAWSGYGKNIEKKENEIHVTDMGLKKLSIANGSFTMQEEAKSDVE
jgi:hypothetical protein